VPRPLEFGIAFLALLISSPVLVLCSVWVKVVSPGPVLFRQKRIGYQMQEFDMIKLRTMHLGAERSGTITSRDDSRVIRGARLLRRYKIDEIPQLLNVLGGTMALVGPRPTVLEDVLRMDDRQRMRYSVRPGLTGLAQIEGNTRLTWPERIEWDLKYIGSRSTAYDVWILKRTVELVFSGAADTHPGSDGEWG